MAVLRGVDAFDALSRRRVNVRLDTDLAVDEMSLEDLVSAKKTQRD